MYQENKETLEQKRRKDMVRMAASENINIAQMK
jgi:hypothetical protein